MTDTGLLPHMMELFFPSQKQQELVPCYIFIKYKPLCGIVWLLTAISARMAKIRINI